MKPRLLPFLEQTALFNSINWSFAAETAAGQNDTLVTTQINTFLCPSDGNVPVGTYTFKNGVTGARQTGYGSYPNNIGTVMNNYGNQFDGPAYVLAAPANGPAVTFATITDGLSNTAMFSEWVRGKNNTTSEGLHQVYKDVALLPPGPRYVPLDRRT